MDIYVEYEIWEIVEHVFNENKFMVVGYNYISGELKYVCLQSEKNELIYISGFELKKWWRYEIGFKKS